MEEIVLEDKTEEDDLANGTTIQFNNLTANFDLTSFHACPDNGMMYLCVELMKGVNPSSDFLLEGNLQSCHVLECRGMYQLFSHFYSVPTLSMFDHARHRPECKRVVLIIVKLMFHKKQPSKIQFKTNYVWHKTEYESEC